MKMIKMIFLALLCTLSFSSFATNVHDYDRNFCSAFIIESIDLCVKAGGGATCNIQRNYQGMQVLYYRLLSSMSNGTDRLDVACRMATARIGEPGEAANCVAKWNCYNGTPSDRTCINPAGTHC